MFSTSGCEEELDGATSPPNQQRCATEMSALIGSPVNVLDLSAVNQFSQQTASNVKNMNGNGPHGNVNCFTSSAITANNNPNDDGDELGNQPPSMDTVKLVGVGQYNHV